MRSNNSIKHGSVEKMAMKIMTTAASYCVLALDRVKIYRHFILSVMITLLFFIPSFSNGSLDAGFLYGGDNLGYYLPALMKTHLLLFKHHFSAIDYSLFNGSSDFFLNANFFPLHPIVVLYSLLVPFHPNCLQSTGQFFVFLLASQCFLACYFSIKLFTRYFFFEFGPAFLIGVGFAFSWYTIAATGEPSYVLCVSIIPWVIYAALHFSEKPSFCSLLLGCLPVTCGFLGGYLPLGVACLAMSAVLVFSKIFFIDATQNHDREKLITLLFFAAIPMLLGCIIVAPYLYAVFKFHTQTTGGLQHSGIFFSAFQLAELPQTIIRIVSSHFVVPGPIAEFSVYWGIIGLTTFGIFFLNAKDKELLNEREWRLFKISAAMYFMIVLSIYGEHSAVSSMVYYFVPQIGKMHIYQRFLYPGQLLLMIMIALMLKSILEVRPRRSVQRALLILILLSFGCGFLMTFRSEYALMFGLNNHLLFELILGCLYAGLLLLPGKKFVYFGVVVLFSLPALSQMYTFSQGGNTFTVAQQRQPLVLNSEVQSNLIRYLKRFGNKRIIKYVDITPLWNKSGIETFPKDFPHLALEECNLSSYGGTTFYLSALADYIYRMPVGGEQVILHPDWQWLKDTGADFIVVTNEEIAANKFVRDLVEKNKQEDLYNLPNDAVIVPLHWHGDSVLYDNGYFRVDSLAHHSRPMINLALNKTARQSGNYTASPAQLAVDGNKDGNYSHGSVTHTSADPNAWLDIDLGQSESIDAIKIWNRTDCCQERLRDYWIFVSDTSFLPTDTVATLRTRVNTWSKRGETANLKFMVKTKKIHGRFVRVQLDGKHPLAESYLSIAEVEVLKFKNTDLPSATTMPASFKSNSFFSNDANYMRFEFEAGIPTVVQYLFWNNPRLKYYLNGQRVTTVNLDGLQEIKVPAGKNTIEVSYIHWPLILFWIFYGLFGLLLLGTLLYKALMLAFNKKRYGDHES